MWSSNELVAPCDGFRAGDPAFQPTVVELSFLMPLGSLTWRVCQPGPRVSQLPFVSCVVHSPCSGLRGPSDMHTLTGSIPCLNPRAAFPHPEDQVHFLGLMGKYLPLPALALGFWTIPGSATGGRAVHTGCSEPCVLRGALVTLECALN